MNFFNQLDNSQEGNENSYNFLGNQEMFNFNQDTFAPENFNRYEESFTPINLKEINQIPSFSFNFNDNQSISSQNNLIQSQSSLINNLFGLDSLNQDRENIDNIESEKIFNRNSQQSKPVNLQMHTKPNISKQPEKLYTNNSKEDDTNITRSHNQTLKSDNLLNMNNALRDVEKLINHKLTNNISLPKSLNNNAINEIENLIRSSNIQNVGNNFQNLLSNNEARSNYFTSSQFNMSQNYEEEPSRKRKIEKRDEEEKKCPKLDNKLLEMKFFENSNQYDKTSGEDLNLITRKSINENKHINNANNNANDIKTINKNYPIKNNQASNNCSLSSIEQSSSNINYVNSNQNKSTCSSLNNNNAVTSSGIKNSIIKENPSNYKHNKPQSKRHHHSNTGTGNKHSRSGNNKQPKMPIIQEENEQKEQEIDYKMKLEEYRVKYNEMQTEVVNIKNKLRIFGGIYEIFNNYISQSENFKLNFRNNFKKFLNDYQEIISNYSLLFIQLNVCHKIEKKTEEFHSIFKQLREKISLNC